PIVQRAMGGCRNPYALRAEPELPDYQTRTEDPDRYDQSRPCRRNTLKMQNTCQDVWHVPDGPDYGANHDGTASACMPDEAGSSHPRQPISSKRARVETTITPVMALSASRPANPAGVNTPQPRAAGVW